MARRDPNRPRHRPGRRPPHRPSAGGSTSGPRTQGFIGPGLRQLFDAVLPMKGRERKQSFNQSSTGLVVGLGLGGTMLGGSWAGPVGAVIGFGVGATAGGLFVEKKRFYRR